jgi:hypothetical protein
MEVLSHDSVLNFLNREDFSPFDLWQRVKPLIDLEGGSVEVDDSILDKPYSEIGKTDLVGRHYSGKHHGIVQGICLVSLFYTDKQGVRVPINYRIYEQGSLQSKNGLFREMLAEVLGWGLAPTLITGDSWYSGLDNLKFIRKHKLDAMFAVEKDRLISTLRGVYEQVQEAKIGGEGLFTHLRNFDMVTVFRTEKGEQTRHYIYYRYYERGEQQAVAVSRNFFLKAHEQHWHIEEFHRAIKQLCNIENFLVRSKVAIKNHIFSALWAFISLEIKVVNKIIANWYQWRELIEQSNLKRNLCNIT